MGQTGGVWLQTARLRLRPLGLADEAGVLAGLNDPEIASWLATTPFPYRVADFRSYVGSAPMGETFSIHDADGFAGLIGGGAELGFWVARRAQGKGYATEAAIGLLAVVFEVFCGPVTSGHFVGNRGSGRVLEKVGFLPLSQGPKFCRPLGQNMDHINLVLPRERYLALHRRPSSPDPGFG